MTVGELLPGELASSLRGRGLRLVIGPFHVELTSSIPGVMHGVRLLYADYPLVRDGAFIDFPVSLRSAGGVRRWIRPQVVFELDGLTPFKPLPLDQAFAMFEWGLNWCIANNAHQYLVIHAAVVERGGRILILPGTPGSGKSTLCAGLVHRGWRLLSDEMALLSLEFGTIVPIPRPVSLKNASIGIIQNFAPDAIFGQTANDTSKGSVAHMKAPTDSVQGAVPGRAAAVVFPRYQPDTAAPQVAQLSRGMALVRVAENCFNYATLGVDGFDALVDMLEGCICASIAYSSLADAMTAIDQVLADA